MSDITAEPIKYIFIVGVEERTQPTAHTVYKIEISGEVRSWTLFKRYSDFDSFHRAICNLCPDHPPPIPLPPKRYFTFPSFAASLSSGPSSSEFIDERKAGLEKYLRAILDDASEVIRNTREWRAFLNIPESRPSATKLKHTSSSWLDDFRRSRQLLAETRELYKKASEEYAKDFASSRSLISQAKKHLATLTVNVHHLEQYIEEIHKRFDNTTNSDVTKEEISLTEFYRRQSILKSLKQEKESVSNEVHLFGQPCSPTIPRSFSPATSSSKSSSTSERTQLLTTTHTVIATGRRAFGVSTPPVETAETRALDNQGLVHMQRDMMKDQDQYLDKLFETIARQKEIAGTISQELDIQNDLLVHLDHEVNNTQGKLKVTEKKISRIS
jgi:regulator of vacuolar morphogenesis